MSNQKLNKQQAQWALFLSRFNLKLVHIPRSKIGRANRLSRWPDWERVRKENKNRMLVKKEWLEARVV